MEFSEVVRRRHMVRRYDPERPVPDEVLAAVLENACRAPSAGFSQGWDFVVLTSAGRSGQQPVSADVRGVVGSQGPHQKSTLPAEEYRPPFTS